MAQAIGVITEIRDGTGRVVTDLVAKVVSLEEQDNASEWYGRLVVNRGGMVTCMSDGRLKALSNFAGPVPEIDKLPEQLAYVPGSDGEQVEDEPRAESPPAEQGEAAQPPPKKPNSKAKADG